MDRELASSHLLRQQKQIQRRTWEEHRSDRNVIIRDSCLPPQDCLLRMLPGDEMTQRTQQSRELTQKSKESPIIHPSRELVNQHPFSVRAHRALPSDYAPNPRLLSGLFYNAPTTLAVVPSHLAERRWLEPDQISPRHGLNFDITYASLQMTKGKCCKRSKENMH